jgi:hypothetical protein
MACPVVCWPSRGTRRHTGCASDTVPAPTRRDGHGLRDPDLDRKEADGLTGLA